MKPKWQHCLLLLRPVFPFGLAALGAPTSSRGNAERRCTRNWMWGMRSEALGCFSEWTGFLSKKPLNCNLGPINPHESPIEKSVYPLALPAGLSLVSWRVFG